MTTFNTTHDRAKRVYRLTYKAVPLQRLTRLNLSILRFVTGTSYWPHGGKDGGNEN